MKGVCVFEFRRNSGLLRTLAKKPVNPGDKFRCPMTKSAMPGCSGGSLRRRHLEPVGGACLSTVLRRCEVILPLKGTLEAAETLEAYRR